MIAAGVYKAKAVDEQHVEFGVSSTGSEQVSVLFDILDARGVATGERIRWFGSFKSPQSAEIAVKALRAAGWSSPDDVTDPRGIGSTVVELVVEEETDRDGKPRTRVKWVNAANKGASGPAFKEALSPQQKRALAAKLKSIVLAAPPPAPAKQGSPTTFDDVPF